MQLLHIAHIIRVLAGRMLLFCRVKYRNYKFEDYLDNLTSETHHDVSQDNKRVKCQNYLSISELYKNTAILATKTAVLFPMKSMLILSIHRHKTSKKKKPLGLSDSRAFLVKSGGLLLSRIALQYHRRKRA